MVFFIFSMYCNTTHVALILLRICLPTVTTLDFAFERSNFPCLPSNFSFNFPIFHENQLDFRKIQGNYENGLCSMNMTSPTLFLLFYRCITGDAASLNTALTVEQKIKIVILLFENICSGRSVFSSCVV